MNSDLSNHELAIDASIALHRLLYGPGQPDMSPRERALIEASADLLWRGLHDKALTQAKTAPKYDSVASSCVEVEAL